MMNEDQLRTYAVATWNNAPDHSLREQLASNILVWLNHRYTPGQVQSMLYNTSPEGMAMAEEIGRGGQR